MGLNVGIGMRDVKTCIKNGYGMEDFLEKFNCSEEDLEKRLNKLVHNEGKVAGILSDIRANDKKKGKKKTRSGEKTEVTGPVMTETKVAELEPVVGVVAAKTQPKSNKSRLSELGKKELKLSNTCSQLEVERNDYLNKRNEIKRTVLVNLRAELEEIEDQYKAKFAEYEKQVELLNEYGEKANELYCEKKQIATELAEVRAEIETLKTINLFVYENGVIEALDHPEFKPDETGAEAEWRMLLEKEDYKDFKIREVQTLAKLIRIVRNSSEKIVVTCENSYLQTAYELLEQGVF